MYRTIQVNHESESSECRKNTVTNSLPRRTQKPTTSLSLSSTVNMCNITSRQCEVTVNQFKQLCGGANISEISRSIIWVQRLATTDDYRITAGHVPTTCGHITPASRHLVDHTVCPHFPHSSAAARVWTTARDDSRSRQITNYCAFSVSRLLF